MLKRNCSPRWLVLPSCLYGAPSDAHFFGMPTHRMRFCIIARVERKPIGLFARFRWRETSYTLFYSRWHNQHAAAV